MRDAWKDFQSIWRPREVVVPQVEPADDPALAAARRADEIRDARVAVNTMFLREYRKRLHAESEKLSPDPRFGSDVGACMTFKREGLIQAERILELMIRLAEEKIPDE